MLVVPPAQTGKAADLVRFPGGSSNTISKKYCYGIMSQLVCAVIILFISSKSAKYASTL